MRSSRENPGGLVVKRTTRCVLLAVCAIAAVALGAPGVAQAKRNKPVWLCAPGLRHDPCKASLAATVVSYEETSGGPKRKEAPQTEETPLAPELNCFYVYPTVSEQETPNANLTIEPQETQIAIDQASRFSHDCHVWAPMYEQLTLGAINNPGSITEGDLVKAYLSLRSSWNEFLKHDDKGRGIVLIGHSQGAALLIHLIEEQIEANPSEQKLFVSAILLGGNVLVPEGKTVGGSFKTVPACENAVQTGCVIAYSSFLKEPPMNSFFGRPGSSLLEGSKAPAGEEVLCVNPAEVIQDGKSAPIEPYAPTTPFPGKLGGGVGVPEASTPWVEAEGFATAQCRHENGATWLQISIASSVSEAQYAARKAHHEVPEELIGPEWGLHLYDVNIDLGNLVATVGVERSTWLRAH